MTEQDIDEALAAVERILLRADLSAAQKCLAIEMLLSPEPTPKLAATVAQAAKNLAWAVWSKTCGRCEYCLCSLNPFDRNAHDGFHIDHVVPRAQNGSDDLDNLVPSCSRCNFVKGARSPDQWGGHRG